MKKTAVLGVLIALHAQSSPSAQTTIDATSGYVWSQSGGPADPLEEEFFPSLQSYADSVGTSVTKSFSSGTGTAASDASARIDLPGSLQLGSLTMSGSAKGVGGAWSSGCCNPPGRAAAQLTASLTVTGPAGALVIARVSSAYEASTYLYGIDARVQVSQGSQTTMIRSWPYDTVLPDRLRMNLSPGSYTVSGYAEGGGAFTSSGAAAFDVQVLPGSQSSSVGAGFGVVVGFGGSAAHLGYELAFDAQGPGDFSSAVIAAFDDDYASALSPGELASLDFAVPTNVLYGMDLGFTGQWTSLPAMTLGYGEDLLAPGFVEEDLALHHFDGASWVQIPGVVDAATNTISVANVPMGRLILGATDVELIGSPFAVSVGSAGSQVLSVDAGQGFAGSIYLILGSASGSVPGVAFGNVVLPLNQDDYMTATFNGANSAIFTNTFGLLDAQGRAAASINVPAGLALDLVGFELFHAALFLAPTTVEVLGASNAVPLTLVP